MIETTLIVIRTSNPEKLAEFYTWLGLTFEYHKRDNSPFHYSAIIGGLTMEIYPLTKSQTVADKYLRLGFATDNFDNILDELKDKNVAFTEPLATDFGFLTVITDYDGRKIELYRK